MIISFSISGFRCFADRVSLDLQDKKFKTVLPSKGKTWGDCLLITAAIYGANASGKTTLIDAIEMLTAAIRSPEKFSRALFQPSAMLATAEQETCYEIEFVEGNVRYQYVLNVQRWGISFEALYSYPKSSRRVLFERKQVNEDSEWEFYKGPYLTGPTAEVLKLTRSWTPFLAIAYHYKHPILKSIADGIALGEKVRTHKFKESTEENAVRRVILEMMSAPEMHEKKVSALLKVADLGVEGIDLRLDEIPIHVRKKMQQFLAYINDDHSIDSEIEFPRFMERVVFIHRGENGVPFEVPLPWQSTGTLAWLGLIWNTLSVLHSGGTLLADELDASLHPTLVRYLVKLFQDNKVNTSGAQLIFTTHDVALLGNSPSQILQPQHVWFTEKDDCGRSELFSLDDFDNRSGNNSEKRYMAGQFGAIPNVDDQYLFDLLISEN